MLWAGGYDLIKQYQEELRRGADRQRLSKHAARAQQTRERAWTRLLVALLSSGGR
jgi:hypothetical protein